MPRLIWVFAGRTCHFVRFVMMWLIFDNGSSEYVYFYNITVFAVLCLWQLLSPNNLVAMASPSIYIEIFSIYSYCHLEDEEEEPHAMNQSILYNNGKIFVAPASVWHTCLQYGTLAFRLSVCLSIWLSKSTVASTLEVEFVTSKL